MFDQWKVGFGLWNHPIPALALEVGLVIASGAFAFHATRAAGSAAWPAALLAGLLCLMQLGMHAGAGPAPAGPDATALVVGAMAVFLGLPLVAWACERVAGTAVACGRGGMTDARTIYHITEAATWERERATGAYRAGSLATEGFIHCSHAGQVLRVANERYRGKPGLVLLSLQCDRLTHELRWENTEGGSELFPHVYGPLDLEAVTRVEVFAPGADGRFSAWQP